MPAVARLAVILGSSAAGPGGEEIVAAVEGHGALVVQRHGGGDAYVLPHAIDHAANLRPLVEAGCDRVLSICSVGSLDAGLGVGSFVCPHDFIALQVTATTFDDPRGHAMPGFDAEWRGRLLAAWEASGAGELRDGGVLLADQRAALRDAGRDRPDRGARRLGRDDDGLGVHRRRRAGPRLRRGLRGRQPGERDRRPAVSRPTEGHRERNAAPARCARRRLRSSAQRAAFERPYGY
jgi:hypothetical protein